MHDNEEWGDSGCLQVQRNLGHQGYNTVWRTAVLRNDKWAFLRRECEGVAYRIWLRPVTIRPKTYPKERIKELYSRHNLQETARDMKSCSTVIPLPRVFVLPSDEPQLSTSQRSQDWNPDLWYEQCPIRIWSTELAKSFASLWDFWHNERVESLWRDSVETWSRLSVIDWRSIAEWFECILRNWTIRGPGRACRHIRHRILGGRWGESVNEEKGFGILGYEEINALSITRWRRFCVILQ